MGLNKEDQLHAALTNLRERWGSRVVRRWEKPATRDIPHVPTGFAALDQALGIGGLPRGQLTQLLGRPTSGMNTLALKVIANAHAEGDMAAYLDLSQTFDPDYAARCGVDVTRLLLVRPTMEQHPLDIARQLIESNGVGVLVVDLTLGGEQLWETTLSPLISQLVYSPCVLVFLTPAEQPVPLSSALGHQAAIRVQLQRIKWLQRRHNVQGYRTSVTILKNRFAAPSRVALVIGFSGVVAGDGT